MSLALTTVTISAIEDRQITFGSAQLARVLTVGSSWTKLRIGGRFSVDDPGGNIAGTPRFVMGVLSAPSAGVANGPLSVTTSHFVGIRTRAATWTRATSPIVYYNVGSLFEAFKRVGNTNTTTAITGTGNFVAVPASYRWPLVMEITKGSPNYTVGLAFWNQSGTAVDYSEDLMWQAMEPETLTQSEAFLDGVKGISKYIVQSVTIAADESDGALDSICFGWDKATPVMRLSEAYFKVIA